MTEDVIRAFLRKSFSIDCHRMVLRPGREPPPRIYQGPGSIWQTRAGGLEFKLYDAGGRDWQGLSRLFGPDAVKSGEVIPREDYFTLEAHDIRGGSWKADYILPDPHQGPGEYGPVMTGSLRRLEQTIPNDRPGALESVLRLRFPAPAEFPADVPVSTEEYLADAGET